MNHKKYAETLRHVAKDLVEYADALEREGPNADWRATWSTYTLEAAGAVFNQLVQDGELKEP